MALTGNQLPNGRNTLESDPQWIRDIARNHELEKSNFAMKKNAEALESRNEIDRLQSDIKRERESRWISREKLQYLAHLLNFELSNLNYWLSVKYTPSKKLMTQMRNYNWYIRKKALAKWLHKTFPTLFSLAIKKA